MGKAPQVFLIDTREQLPLSFEYSRTVTLKVGDYTTVTHHNRLHIERKSPADLYGTLLKGHKRFRKEVLRAAEHNIELIVVVECTKAKFMAKDWRGASYCKVDSVILDRIIRTMTKRYGLKFVWCASRAAMKRTITRLLK